MNTFATLSMPTRHDVETALTSQRELAAHLDKACGKQHIQVFDDMDQPHSIALPSAAVKLLVDILKELAQGNAVKVIPVHAEVTTQEAADLLNASRPHLVKLVEAGELPFHKTGKHRRIRLSALMAYKAKRDARSEAVMMALTRQAQDLDTGYE